MSGGAKSGGEVENPHEIIPLMDMEIHSEETEDPEKVEDNVLGVLAPEEPNITTVILSSNRSPSISRSSGRRNTDILESAEVNDFDWTIRCLTKDSSPEATCKLGMMSVCHLAAYFGGVEILREVISRRPDLFKRADSVGRTPLHYAAWQGHLDCLTILLGLHVGDLAAERIKNGKEPEIEIEIGQDKLQYLNSTSGEIIEHYDLCDASHTCSNISKNLDVVWSECTPLHEACANVQADCVLALLVCGADVAQQDKQGRTPLDVLGLAIKEAEQIFTLDIQSFVRIIEDFVQYGKRNSVGCEKWLSNKDGTSPLFIAILFGSRKATELLLEHGAVPYVKDEYGQTSLHLAVLYRRTYILKRLINSQTNCYIDVLNRDERTPLQLAVMERWYEGVSILLDADASIINQSNCDENTALHFAAQVGDLKILEKLIKKLPNKKESIDIENKSGETPLFVAIKNGNDECVRCLIFEDASKFRDSEGNTVIHMAIETENSDVLISLLDIETIRNFLTTTDVRDGTTPLHRAALKGRAHYTEILISKEADLSIPNMYGHTALHIAAKEGHSEVIKVILNKDTEKRLVNMKDNEGWLPFHRAAYHCKRESIELFLKNGSNLAEIVPNESNSNLIVEIIKKKMARPAEFLTNTFDSCITFPSDYNFDDSDSEIILNYSILIPDEQSGNQTQMDAIAALFSPGSNPEIKKLIFHPFIESFVFLKWETLQPLFYLILTMYCIFVGLFTDLTIRVYDKSTNPLSERNMFFQVERYITMALIIVLGIVEIYFMQLSGCTKYFWRLEGVVKPCSLIMAFFVSLSQTEIRLLIAVAYFFCWMEIPIMLSRFQQVGYYHQMFSKVALRVIKVFAFFGCFIIIGFSLIFWILKANSSFSTFWNSFIKTVVMMTSEYDYSSMLDNSVKVDQVAFQTFFIIFLVCVPIVLMNLLLALAVTDVKDLKTEGKIQRFMEQVAFLGNMEMLVGKNISKKIINVLFCHRSWKVENKMSVYPGISYKDKKNILAKDLIERLLDNLNERKRKEEKDQRLMNKKKFEDGVAKKYDELHKIVKQISDDQKNNNSKENAISAWGRLLKK